MEQTIYDYDKLVHLRCKFQQSQAGRCQYFHLNDFVILNFIRILGISEPFRKKYVFGFNVLTVQTEEGMLNNILPKNTMGSREKLLFFFFVRVSLT